MRGGVHVERDYDEDIAGFEDEIVSDDVTDASEAADAAAAKDTEKEAAHITIADANAYIDKYKVWDEVCSYGLLRLKGIDVLAVENRDETDRNERFYFISRPNEKYLWRENGGIPYCPQCYERITKKWTDEGVSFTPEEVIAKCSAKLDDKGKVKGYCGIKIREVKDLPFHDRLSVITLLQNDYRCSNRYVDEHGRSRECGCRYTPPHPFYKKGQQYTDRYARALGDASLTKKSFQQVAYDFHTTDRTVIKYFEEEIKRRKEECKFETPEHIGIDEAKVHTNERGGAFYVCVMNTDPDAPEKNGIIEFEKMKRTAEEVEKIFERFDNPDKVKTISMDMCNAYRVAAENVFQAGCEGHARIIVDRFHLVQSLNDKVKDVVKALYQSTLSMLKSTCGIESSDFTEAEFSLMADEPSESEKDFLYQKALESLDDKFEIEDKVRKADIGPLVFSKSKPREFTSAEVKELLKILKDGYSYKWFVMNPQDLKPLSQARFFKLLNAFPEFKNVYIIKEMMRWDFFDAKTKEQAQKVSVEAEAMLPRGKEYAPLRTYFKTLNKSDWTRHIYAYFEDEKGHRHSNAKLENLNRIVKEINGIGNGMSWDRLKKKVLYGELSVRRTEPRFSRKKKLEAAKTMYMSMIGSNVLLDDEVQPLLPGMPPQSEFLSDVKLPMAPEEEADMQPSKEDWECIFAIPAIADDKSLAFMDGMTLDEKIHAVESNSNIRVIIALHLEGYIRSGAAGDEEYSEKQEIIHPLTFDEWNAHEDFYMAILKEDAKALERYDAGEGEEED